MVDTYEESFRYVTNYVVADTLSVRALGHHLKKGHLYIAFKSLGDATGFMYYSKDREGKVSGILGDSVAVDQARSLHAVSPLPGQFRLIRNGELVRTSGEGEYEYNWSGPVQKGVYRVEVHIKLGDEDVPWVYSNP